MPTDPTRAKAIFLEATELPDDAARAAYLDRACGADAELRQRVEALFRSHDPDGSFLRTPAAVVPDPDFAGTVAFDSSNPGGGPAKPDADDESADLKFLTPSSRPDSLGRLGHYEMLQVLGRGGFGIVFRAFDDILQRVVAVKVMAPQIASLSPARKRFVREAQSSAKVRHENVVQVHEVGEQPLPYLVMEFIPGETLQQKLDRSGPLDVPEVLRIGRQIAEGLAAAHACDLIHRDIKPGNILLEGGSHKAKITDFGLARAADDASISQSGIIAGTPMFMAPEQALGHKIDQRADLFSLGSVLYQMASGRPPFRAPSTLAVLKRVAEEPPRPIPEIIPETPDWLCGIIAKLHAKNPADRFQSAREVADLLADCEAKLKAKQAVKNVLPAAVKPAAPTASGGRKWIAAAALLLLPMIALAVTEFAGVTHLFRQQATSNPIKPGGEPTPVPAVEQGPLPPTYKNSLGMEFAIVPKGKSWLGGGKDKLGDKEVEIPADFYLGKYEVTQEEWTQVMGANPSHFSRTGDGKDAVKDISDADLKLFPVENASWDQCQVFLAKLNQREKETGWVYRLPTAVEWEYACRGGPMADKADSAFDFYFAKPTNTLLPKQANFETLNDKVLKRTCKLGSYEQPNTLGLYDMHGNTWEWCEDTEKVGDGPTHRVYRGGCWFVDSGFCKAACRFTHLPSVRSNDLGLRVARVPAGAPSPEAKTLPEPSVHDTWLKATALLPLDEHTAALPAKLKERLPGFEDAMLRTIPSLAADREAIMVAAWLRDRNPAFEGEVKHKIEGGVLTSLEVPSLLVQDLTPLRALPGLRTFTGRTTLGYDNQATRDAALLQSLKTLTHINGKPVAQFWKDAEAKQAEFNEWLTLVPTLTAPQQVAAVVAKLKERNPGLDGTAAQEIKDGVVAHLKFIPIKGQDALTDISPVRALAGLTSLTLWGCVGLEDLEPLKGMPLTYLNLFGCAQVRELEPLKGMSLTFLNLQNCPQVRNLEPLKGMPLTYLNLYGCRGVENLKSLEGMPLQDLVLRFCNQVRDLESLKGMPLTSLSLGTTQVRDLEPLKGMPLTVLDLDGTPIRDLELLKGMPLKKLFITGRDVTDLKPLQGMEMEEIRLTPKNITQGLDILRDMKSLKTIGIGSLSTQLWPAAEFWERYDKGEFKE